MCWCPFLSAKEDGSPGFSTHLLASLIWENSQVGREGSGGWGGGLALPGIFFLVSCIQQEKLQVASLLKVLAAWLHLYQLPLGF